MMNGRLLPLEILGNETHNLLHCPYFSPLAQPAIQSHMLNLRLRKAFGPNI